MVYLVHVEFPPGRGSKTREGAVANGQNEFSKFHSHP
jgi:hypothetical protein